TAPPAPAHQRSAALPASSMKRPSLARISSSLSSSSRSTRSIISASSSSDSTPLRCSPSNTLKNFSFRRSICSNTGLHRHFVHELGVLLVEAQPHAARLALALLGEDDFHHALGALLPGPLGIVVIVAVEEDDDVGELLDVAAVAQVRHDGALVVAALHRAVQLRQQN